MRRATLIAGVMLVLLALGLPSLAQPADPLSARAFAVRYRTLSDAADVISAVLSSEGSVTLRPRLATLVVEDRESVLKRVAALLESYDLPPRSVEISMSLFLGQARPQSDDPAIRRDASGLSREVRGVLDSLGDVTKWTSYEQLGSRAVTGTEGETIVADLSEDYRVVILVEAVHESNGLVKFRQFTLQRLETAAQQPQFRDVYTTGMVLAAGRLTVVGAAKDPESDRALFLTLQAVPR